MTKRQTKAAESAPEQLSVNEPHTPYSTAASPVSAKRPASPLGFFPADVADAINAMRSGAVGGAIIPRVADQVGVTQERLLKDLGLPRSTMKARIARNASLSATEQDRIYRVEKVLARACAVFEDSNAARAWIVRQNRALGTVSPLSLLDTEAGYELVLDTLGRIEYGVIS